MTSITGNSYLDTFTAAKADATKKNTGNSSLDQAAFLKLMTTQLQTQDPTAPVDNTQMIAQMAQFSQVAGVTEMNATLKGMATELQAARMGDAASWIGRSALVESGTWTAGADGGYSGQIALTGAATSVDVTLTDSNGTIVHRDSLGATNAGATDYKWDGRNEAGKTVATGPLKISVAAKGKSGTVESGTAAWTKVTGVQSPAGGASARLVTALGLFSATDTISLT